MHALTIGQAGSRLPLTFLIISVTSNPDTLHLRRELSDRAFGRLRSPRRLRHLRDPVGTRFSRERKKRREKEKEKEKEGKQRKRERREGKNAALRRG